MADQEPTREGLEAENAELRRELEKHQRAQEISREAQAVRPKSHDRNAWMLM